MARKPKKTNAQIYGGAKSESPELTGYVGQIETENGDQFAIEGVIHKLSEGEPPEVPEVPETPPKENDWGVMVVKDAKGGIKLNIENFANYEFHVTGNLRIEQPTPAKGRDGCLIFMNPGGFEVKFADCWKPVQFGDKVIIGKGVWLLVYYNAYDSDEPIFLCNTYETIPAPEDDD